MLDGEVELHVQRFLEMLDTAQAADLYFGPRCHCGFIYIVLPLIEYFRSSNTAKLLLRACPGSAVFVSGVKQQEDELFRLMHEEPESTFVLFPAESAMSVSLLCCIYVLSIMLT